MELGGGPYIAADLRDANEILHDRAALNDRLGEDGYLLVRGLRSKESVREARRQIVERLETRTDAHAPATTGVRGNVEMLGLPGVQALFRMREVISFLKRCSAARLPRSTFNGYAWPGAAPNRRFIPTLCSWAGARATSIRVGPLWATCRWKWGRL